MENLMSCISTQTTTAGAARVPQRRAPETLPSVPATTYRTVSVDGLKMFYREAGDPKARAVLLLHGFPTSSHMYRELIPALADRYHVVAPDLPGFGFSEAPNRKTFKYTFDHLAEVMERFTEVLGLRRYTLLDGFGKLRFTEFCHRYDCRALRAITDGPFQNEYTLVAEDVRAHAFGNDAD